MTIYRRTRIMLVIAIALLGATMWVVVDQQRSSVLDGEAQVVGAGDLLTAMLDQETGVRGYDQTGSQEFLEPYWSGRDRFEGALTEAGERTDDPKVRAQLRAMGDLAHRWQALADGAVARVSYSGAHSLTIRGARERKALMDRFRDENDRFRGMVRHEAATDLATGRWRAIGTVVLLGTILLGGGLLLVERSARRDRALRSKEEEFIESLQGADDEREAQQLLSRHVERAVPGSSAVVLSRNASGNMLTAATDVLAVDGLAARLEGATPRDCLAVRRGAPYARGARDEPLQPCAICGDLPGVARCTPSLVGGEVIGSLLVTRSRAIGERRVETISGAVNQAAPVLANLRNLAIAEHRAATDALTGLPNARSVREALVRMVAQAGRSVQPLAAVALDLDHFKALNDRFGHQVGDEALAAVGGALAATVRASDFAGRWGGEEFLILLPDTGVEGAALLAEKVRAAIAALSVPGVPGSITASCGVAALPEHAAEADELLRAADRALYAAKAGGRNRVARAGDSAAAAPPVTADSD